MKAFEEYEYVDKRTVYADRAKVHGYDLPGGLQLAEKFRGRKRCDPGCVDTALQNRQGVRIGRPSENWLIRVTVNQCKMLFRSPWRKAEDLETYAETLGF